MSPAAPAELGHLVVALGLGQDARRPSRMKAYRANSPPLAFSLSAPAGRGAAEELKRGRAGGGSFSLICAPSELGKKICHSNVAIARAKSTVFVRSAAAFIANWGPKVTQLGGGRWDPLKTESATLPNPS